jgi:hypothetical protein
MTERKGNAAAVGRCFAALAGAIESGELARVQQALMLDRSPPTGPAPKSETDQGSDRLEALERKIDGLIDAIGGLP